MDDGCYKIASAYSTLSSTRAIGFQSGPIPWDKVLLWAQHKGLLPHVFDHLWNCIQAIDSIYMARAAAAAPKTPNTPKDPEPSVPPGAERVPARRVARR